MRTYKILFLITVILLLGLSQAAAANVEVNVTVNPFAKASIEQDNAGNYLRVLSNSSWQVQTDGGDAFSGGKTGSQGETLRLSDDVNVVYVLPR